MSHAKKEVAIDFRDLNVMYNVDYKSVQEIAEHYNIEWIDAKQALRDSGITVRINEPKPDSPERDYTIVLTDKLNLKAKATTANKSTKTAAAVTTATDRS